MKGIHMRIPVRPLMRSEAPCRGGGLFTSYFQFNNPQIEYYPIFQNFKRPSTTTNSYTLKVFRKEKSSKNSQKIIEPRTPS